MTQDKIFIECSNLLHGFKNLLNKALTVYEWPLSTTHFKVMLFIEKMQPCTSLAVTAKLKRDKAQVARLIQDLLKSGFIQKTPNPTDKRSQLLELTDVGHHTFQEVNQAKQVMLDRLFEGITPEEQDVLLAHLMSVSERLESQEYLQCTPKSCK